MDFLNGSIYTKDENGDLHYFGDVFNREDTLAYATGESSHAESNKVIARGLSGQNATFTCNNVSFNEKALKDLTTAYPAVTKSSISCTTDSLQKKIDELREKLDALMDSSKPLKGLRAQMHTLNYKREVE